MNSHTKFWAIFWICAVALFTKTEGTASLVWPICFAVAIAAVALAPNPKLTLRRSDVEGDE